MSVPAYLTGSKLPQDYTPLLFSSVVGGASVYGCVWVWLCGYMQRPKVTVGNYPLSHSLRQTLTVRPVLPSAVHPAGWPALRMEPTLLSKAGTAGQLPCGFWSLTSGPHALTTEPSP